MFANAYDMVINGTEVGGGSIRIHDRATQAMTFNHLGFTAEEAKKQFGFLLEAFEFGAPRMVELPSGSTGCAQFLVALIQYGILLRSQKTIRVVM
jgi:aspartyl-tRNA synthetase